jgi:signal transduction histidine kinase
MAMFTKLSSPDPFKIFYVVFTYVIVFSLWWGYLLYAKNEAAFQEKVELNTQKFELQFADKEYTQSIEYKEILNKHNRQRFMIVTEGGVFFVLLLLGLIVVRRVFKREMELAAQQRNFLLSITHELKSPLSSIKASLQTMLMRNPDADKVYKLMSNSLSDVERLQSLVDNILFAAKIERSEPGFLDEEVDVSTVVQQTAEKFTVNKKGVGVTKDIEQGLTMHIDPLGFTSVVINLIENAVKYSPERSRIDVSLKMAESCIVLKIADEGYGIPENEREKVFEKFYRIGNEDTRRAKGTGLGLYIVRRFVDIYGGSIVISSNSPSGTIFEMKLPVK